MLMFDPLEAQNRMKSIQSHYDQLFREIDRDYRINITGLMAKSWISPNGYGAVKEVVKELNDILDKITLQLGKSFAQLNDACLITMNALTDPKIGGGYYEGPYYRSMTFEKSNIKFKDDDAKTNLDGKLVIYEEKLVDVIGNLQKFDIFVKERLDSIERNACLVPIEDDGDRIKTAIKNNFRGIKSNIDLITTNACEYIRANLDESEIEILNKKKAMEAIIQE